MLLPAVYFSHLKSEWPPSQGSQGKVREFTCCLKKVKSGQGINKMLPRSQGGSLKIDPYIDDAVQILVTVRGVRDEKGFIEFICWSHCLSVLDHPFLRSA